MSVLSLFKLDGKKALVTGGGRGLGKEMAVALAEAGADVAVAQRRVEEGEETAKEIRKLGRQAIAIRADMSKEADIEQMVKTVVDKFGRIDICVNNAGIAKWKAAEEMTLDEWNELMDINLTGVFLCCKHVGKVMIKQKKGSIINISSMSGYIVNIPQKQCHYNASKAAVHHLSKSLAVEWAPYNIRVNAICPGYMLTPLLKLADKEILDEWAAMTAQKRIADPSEIKGLCIFLASEASSYVTGSAILIDGGYTLP